MPCGTTMSHGATAHSHAQWVCVSWPMCGSAFAAGDHRRAVMDGTSDDYDSELAEGFPLPTHGWRLSARMQQHEVVGADATLRPHASKPQLQHKLLQVEVPVYGQTPEEPSYIRHFTSPFGGSAAPTPVETRAASSAENPLLHTTTAVT